MKLLALGLKGFLRRKKTSAVFAAIVFVSALSIMLNSIIIGVAEAFRAANENPYYDYYRMIVDKSYMVEDPELRAFFGDMKYESKDTMSCGNYIAIEEINSYFCNITDYTVEISEPVYTSAKAIIKNNIEDRGVNMYSIPECMGMAGFAHGEISLVQGRYLTSDDNKTGAKVCLVSENLALLNGYSLGDQILIESDYHSRDERNETLEIVGIVKSNIWRDESGCSYSHQLFDNTIYAPLSSTTHGSFSRCYNYQIKLDDDRHIDRIEELANKYIMAEGDVYFIKVSDIYEADNRGVHTLVSALNAAKTFFIFVSLAVIALYTYSMIQSRKKEIGLFFAIGYSKPKTALILAAELSLCILIGTALAVLTVCVFGRDLSEAALSFAAEGSLANSVVASSSETVVLSREKEAFIRELVSGELVSASVVMSSLQALAVAALSSFAATAKVFGIKVIDLLGKGGAR